MVGKTGSVWIYPAEDSQLSLRQLFELGRGRLTGALPPQECAHYLGIAECPGPSFFDRHPPQSTD